MFMCKILFLSWLFSFSNLAVMSDRPVPQTMLRYVRAPAAAWAALAKVWSPVLSMVFPINENIQDSRNTKHMVDCASITLSSPNKYNAIQRFENGICELANYVRNKLSVSKLAYSYSYIQFCSLVDLLHCGRE